MRIAVNPGQWGWSFESLRDSWREAESCGFAAISCFDHVTAAPRGLAAWDAPSLLTAMGSSTSRVGVWVSVIDVCLRNPFLLAGQLAVAQAASEERLEVGLGIGAPNMAPFDFAALGKPFPPRTERIAMLARLLELLPALWRGETVTDQALALHEASLGPLGIKPPPLVVGGRSSPLLELAARHADGWNAVVSNAEQFAELNQQLDHTCTLVGRTRPLNRTAQLFVQDLDLTDTQTLVTELQQACADAVVLVLTRDEGPAGIRRLAEAVLPPRTNAQEQSQP